MYVQQLYSKNSKGFEKFLLSDYPAIYSLKLDKIADSAIEFDIYMRDEYSGRMVVTDYYVDEPLVSSRSADCRHSAKSIKLAKMLSAFAGKEYVDKYVDFRNRLKANIVYKFDCETEKLEAELLNCV